MTRDLCFTTVNLSAGLCKRGFLRRLGQKESAFLPLCRRHTLGHLWDGCALDQPPFHPIPLWSVTEVKGVSDFESLVSIVRELASVGMEPVTSTPLAPDF